MEKIKSLMAPNVNVAIVQQSILLKYKTLYHFLVQRHQEAATELRLHYIQIMNGYCLSKFSKYVARMQKLQAVIADKNDMLGLDESAKKGTFRDVLMATS
jgi:hypothetical protein